MGIKRLRRVALIFRPDGRCFLAILKGDKDQAGNRIDKNREDPEERMVLVTVTESSLLTIE
jgi:hypothetical protein